MGGAKNSLLQTENELRGTEAQREIKKDYLDCRSCKAALVESKDKTCGAGTAGLSHLCLQDAKLIANMAYSHSLKKLKPEDLFNRSLETQKLYINMEAMC